jgi:hypothetical protein
MPAEGGTITVTTSDSTAWMPIGEVLYVQGWGWLSVDAVPSSTSVTLLNLENSATGAYAPNAAPGTLLAASAIIAPGGLQGIAGTPAAGTYFPIATNLVECVPATVRANIGLGTVATYDVGTADGQIPPVESVGGIGVAEAVFGSNTGNGLISYPASGARSRLGLGTAAVLDASNSDGDVPLVDDVAGLTNGEAVFATATGVESLSAAAARAALGISSSSLEYLLFRQVEAAGAQGGAFASAAWRTVPLNTKVSDPGGNGSIAANQITLAAGTYRYSYGLIGNQVDAFRGRLYNTTAAALITDSYSASEDTNGYLSNFTAAGAGRFTLGVSSVIELQGMAETTGTFGQGYGVFAINEYYSWISLEKE